MIKELCVVGGVSMLLASQAGAGDAVQWRVEDGGNGHWYRFTTATYPSWNAARSAAESDGAHLATINSQEEWGFVRERGIDCYIGGYQDPNSPTWSEPAGGWRWVTGEPWSLGPWAGFSPNDAPCHVTAGDGTQDAAWISSQSGGIIDDIEMAPVPYCLFSLSKPAVIEWSADCNYDNIVDYGQILLGQLADANGNGIPDICESPTCHDVDLYRNGRIDGADLAALLSEWGPVNATTRSDFNHDGRVDGSDLAFLLSNWGPCPQ